MILFFQLSGIALAAATYKSPDFRRTVNIHCETPDGKNSLVPEIADRSKHIFLPETNCLKFSWYQMCMGL